jgi:hypothetical protein
MAVTMNPTPAGVAVTPAPSKAVLSTNYITDFDFLNQYLPDLYEKEFERYGNRSIASFLRLVGAEVPSNSDLIKWSEQGRLHVIVKAATRSGETIAATAHSFRVNQTVIVSDGVTTAKALITGATADDITVAAYGGSTLTAAGLTGTSGLTVYVYGSEFKKGTNGMSGSLEANSDIFENSPIIIKDKYEVAGSDMAQIGWIEVTTENGATGYLWYLKSEHETRLRFEDYLETSMVEGELAAAGSAAKTAGYKGTEGLFSAIESRGNIATGSIAGKTDVESIVKVLDKQGAIQENVMFVNRAKSFEIDNMLAGLNTYGTSGAASFGLFDNDKDMALELGFSGFNIGYDFYKSDWKYLNDATTRGAIDDIDGVIVPAGTTTIYDQVLGKNAKRPFLHVRYRKSEAEDRKYKTWTLGSAGGASTSDLDAMQVHFLSERALCVMGANNFVLLK